MRRKRTDVCLFSLVAVFLWRNFLVLGCFHLGCSVWCWKLHHSRYLLKRLILIHCLLTGGETPPHRQLPLSGKRLKSASLCEVQAQRSGRRFETSTGIRCGACRLSSKVSRSLNDLGGARWSPSHLLIINSAASVSSFSRRGKHAFKLCNFKSERGTTWFQTERHLVLAGFRPAVRLAAGITGGFPH